MRQLYIIPLLLAGCAAQAQTVGFFSKTAASQDGYVLFAPITSGSTYLIDKCGKQVHSWTSAHKPGQSVYLLPDGSLLRPGNMNNTVFTSGGTGGIVEQYDWSSALTWSYTISGPTECQHHDICKMPNGNILAIVWELKTTAAAIAAGRAPSLTGTSFWSEKIVELQPSGSSAAIVWEWHVWDHLVQDFDAAKPDYAPIATHPEKINLNYYTGSATNADWLHINSIDYNAGLDQVMVSVHNFNEIWVIDHSTTSAEAATHTGGAHGRGGDLLYRWGNPAAYSTGTTSDRMLYGQHNARWIESGLADAGKILIFNNGAGRPAGNYSTVEVIAPPVNASGDYALSAGSPYLPDTAWWTYKAPVPTNFFGMNISGAQRLPNGNTLVCSGPSGTLFEVDTDKNIAWKYVVPVNNAGPITQGTTPTQNATFRCTLYPGTYNGFTGHTLVPGAPIELSPLPYACEVSGLEVLPAATRSVSVVNPFRKSVMITTGIDWVNPAIVLSDMQGRMLQQWQGTDMAAGGKYGLGLAAALPAGVYVLRISDAQNSISVKLECSGD